MTSSKLCFFFCSEQLIKKKRRKQTGRAKTCSPIQRADKRRLKMLTSYFLLLLRRISTCWTSPPLMSIRFYILYYNFIETNKEGTVLKMSIASSPLHTSAGTEDSSLFHFHFRNNTHIALRKSFTLIIISSGQHYHY